MKKTIILVRYGMIAEIAATLNISTRSVRRALNGNKSVREYEKIRKCALEKGGLAAEIVDNNNSK